MIGLELGSIRINVQDGLTLQYLLLPKAKLISFINVCDRMDPVGDVQSAREEARPVDTTAVCGSLEQTTSLPEPSTIPSIILQTTIEENIQDQKEQEEDSEGPNQAYELTNETASISPCRQPTDGVPQFFVANAQTNQPCEQELTAMPDNGGPSHVYTTSIPSNQTSSPENLPSLSTWHVFNPQTIPALPSTILDHPPGAAWSEQNQQVLPESSVYCEGISQVYQTNTTATQPLSPSSHSHAHTSTWLDQNLQGRPEIGGFWESQSQANTINTPTIQTLSSSSPLNNSAITAWQDQNLQAITEPGRYWEGLPQAYTTSTNHPVLPPPHHYPPFPAWSEESVQVQPESGRYWERLPQAYAANTSAQPVPAPHPSLHQFHQAYPSWPEQNIQMQPQAGAYWEPPFRQPGPYTIAAAGQYNLPQSQEDSMLQGHLYNVGSTYDQGQVGCNHQMYSCVRCVIMYKNV